MSARSGSSHFSVSMINELLPTVPTQKQNAVEQRKSSYVDMESLSTRVFGTVDACVRAR